MTDIAINTFLGIVFAVAVWSIYRSIRNGLTKFGEMSLPTCFASEPGPQDVAERDCFTCHFANACLPEEVVNRWVLDIETYGFDPAHPGGDHAMIAIRSPDGAVRFVSPEGK